MRSTAPLHARWWMSLIGALILTACNALPQPPPLPPPTRPAAGSRPSQKPILHPEGVVLDWVFALGGENSWAPQVLNGADGSELVIASSEAGSVVALEAETGAERWRFTPDSRLWTDSVTVVEDGVFVANQGGVFRLVDGASGEELWQASVQPPDDTPVAGLEARSHPVLAEDILYIPTAGIGSYAPVTNYQAQAQLIAVDRHTGRELWRAETDTFILRALFVDLATDTIYVGGVYLTEREIDEGGPNRIYAFDRQSGHVRWTYESDDGLVKALAVEEGVLAFVGYRDFLVGLDAATGEELWRHNTGNWVQTFTTANLPGVPPKPMILYGAANAFLNAVDPVTGAFVWRYNIEGTFNYPVGKVAVRGGTIYFISQHGELHALDAASGALLWRHPAGLEVRDGVALGRDRLYIATVQGAVYAFRLQP